MAPVPEHDHGVAVDQIGALAIGRRHLDGVDAEDVTDRCGLGRRPPSVEGDRATVVERVEHGVQLMAIGATVAVETLDRVVGQTASSTFIRAADEAADELAAPLPGLEIGEI